MQSHGSVIVMLSIVCILSTNVSVLNIPFEKYFTASFRQWAKKTSNFACLENSVMEHAMQHKHLKRNTCIHMYTNGARKGGSAYFENIPSMSACR